MNAVGAALIGAAVIAGLVVGLVLFQPEIEPAREFKVSTGLAYLRLEPKEVVNDPVLGNGTMLTYVAEVVITNEEDTMLVLKTTGLSLPAEVYVETQGCAQGNITITVAPTEGGEVEASPCLTPLSVLPNEQVRVTGAYLTTGDLLLGREAFREVEPSSAYYIPPGYELHYVISGAVFVPEPVDRDIREALSKGWVLALVSVTGQGYDVKGSFHDTVVVNATLLKAPDGSLYYLGPYGHIIANSPEEAEILPRS